MKIKRFLNSNPVAMTYLSAHAIERKVRTDLLNDGLTFMQALVLVSIFFENEKTVLPSQLTQTFGLSKSNLSHLLNRLQEAGHVSRKTNAKDKRHQPVKLTSAGEKLCSRLIKYFDSIQSSVEREHNDEKKLDRFVQEIRSLETFVGSQGMLTARMRR